MCRLPSPDGSAAPVSLGKVRPLLIFDWDDTLFPTCALTTLGCDFCSAVSLDPETLKALTAHAVEAFRLLQVAQLCGDVVIITAAQAGWVEHTCAVFLTELLPAICGPDAWVSVVSARAVFEPLGYSSSYEWKQKAFEFLASHHFASSVEQDRHIISIGDADYERQALLSVSKSNDCVGKSLKLLESPTLSRLTAECRLVRSVILELTAAAGHMDLQMTADA